MSLEKFSLFNYLTNPELRQIGKLMEEVEFQKGELLMREHEPGDCFYLIESGEVSVFKEDERFTIATLGPGESVGLMAVIDDSVRSASVKATTHVKAFRIEAKAFKALSEIERSKTYYKIISNYLKSQQDYLRDTNIATITALKRELKSAKQVIRMGYIFAFTIVILAVYIIIARFIIESVKAISTTTFITAILILATSIAVAIVIKMNGLKLRNYGVNLKNWKQALTESILVTFVLLIIGTLIKWLLITYYPPMMHSDLFELRFFRENVNFALLISSTYALFCLLQEFIFRGAIQGTLQQILTGEYLYPKAIILSTLIFSMAHIHLANPLFPLAVIIPSIVWGVLYARHGTLLGVAVSHIMLGVYMIDILGFRT